jgi:hypothetical protein
MVHSKRAGLRCGKLIVGGWLPGFRRFGGKAGLMLELRGRSGYGTRQLSVKSMHERGTSWPA